MNPLLALLFLLWSGFALADPASLPDELAEEAGMLGSILSDGRAVFYPESASYLPLSSLSGPGYSTGVAVLITLVSLSRQPLQHSVMREPEKWTSQLQPNSKNSYQSDTSLRYSTPAHQGRFLVAI